MIDDQNYYYQKMLKAFEDFNTDKKSTDALRKIENFAQMLRHELMDEQKAYFISVNQIGPDDNFVEIYTFLGWCTETQADKACSELSDDNGYGHDTYLKLTKEEYDKYVKVRRLTTSCHKLEDVKYLSESGELVNQTIQALRREIEDLRKEVGLTRRWQVISEQTCFLKDEEDDENDEYDY